MNVSNIVNTNKKTFSNSILNTQPQKNQKFDVSGYVSATKKLQEQNKTKKAKKTKAKPRLVTNATSKQDIRRLMKTLNQKIGEVMRGEDSPKLKDATIQILRQKMDSLMRILRSIEREEREKLQAETKVEHEKKKKTKESVYLTSDDLTVEGSKNGSSANGTAVILNSSSAALNISSAASTAAASSAVSASAPIADAATVDVTV